MNSKRGATRSPLTRVESTGASVLCGASSPSMHGVEISNSQRDQIRATIIINLGGSDSDASRATSALNKSNTSESAGGSPHASTSSTSDREQSSILEESSVSTDSGLGSSDEVDEIESPPTEGNTLGEEPSSSIYKRHMCLKKHGFPLWIPQPNEKLSSSYQRQGVSIGDVGIFTPDGGFDFLFNVCLPAGHPSNPEALPEGFVPLELKPTDVRKFHAHSSHSHLISPSVKRRDRATFECSGSDGAILAMPQGAHHEDLKNIRKFREYAMIHAESWYLYAKGPCGEEIGNGELHLVTGCDKTTLWGIATYSHLPSKRTEDNVSILRFNPFGNGQSSYTTYEWDYEGAGEAKSGPEQEQLMNLGVNGSFPPQNQCTFIRSLTPAFGDSDWKDIELKVESSMKDQASVGSPKSPFPSVLRATGFLSGGIGSLHGSSSGGSSEVIDSMTPAQTTAAHPAAYVIDMMLRKCPKAKVVVVHDSDWCSVIRDSDIDWTSTAQDLPRRIQEAFHIVEEKNGTVYLEGVSGGKITGLVTPAPVPVTPVRGKSSSVYSDKGETPGKFNLKDLLASTPELSRKSSQRSTSSKRSVSDAGKGNGRPRSTAGDSTASLTQKYGVSVVTIGKGAASVIRIAHRSEEKLYAIKEFRKRRKNESEKEYVKKLTAEFCISSTLNHPNVVETVDLIQDENQHWCEVIEFCPGGDLYHAIKKGGMSPSEAECCFKQILMGVSYLHSQGVAHRDIKPENLFFDTKGHLKIGDYGASTVYRLPWEATIHMSTGLCGSEPYIAPEQFLSKPYDARLVDIWAVGIVYYCLHFQELPWRAAQPASDQLYAAYASACANPSTSVSICPPTINNLNPLACRSLIRKMLEPDPRHRSTIEEVVNHAWVKSIEICHEVSQPTHVHVSARATGLAYLGDEGA